MRYCLVTGGAGFIGSHLVEHLLRDGWNVRVLDNLSTGKAKNLKGLGQRIDFIQGTINDASILRPAIAGCDVVFHLAALPSVARSLIDPMTTHEVCATGTLSVLDAARQMGVRRVVYAASSSAYGGTPGALRSETDPIAPLSPYASSKLSGELYCQSFTTVYGLETVRLRFFNIFGPRQDARSPYTGVIALFIAGMLERKRPSVQGDGLQSRQAGRMRARVPTVPGSDAMVAATKKTGDAMWHRRCGRNRLKGSAASLESVHGARNRRVEVGEWIAEIRGMDFGAIGVRQLPGRSVGTRKQHAHGDPQFDIHHVITRSATVREARDIPS